MKLVSLSSHGCQDIGTAKYQRRELHLGSVSVIRKTWLNTVMVSLVGILSIPQAHPFFQLTWFLSGQELMGLGLRYS